MVNVIQPQNRTSVTLNVDSGEIDGGDFVPNSLEQLAEQTGIVGAINNINHESQKTDHELREDYNIRADSPEGHNHPQYEEEEEYHPHEQREYESEVAPKKRPIKKKNKTADQRIRELSYQNLQTQHEKEELENELKRLRDEHAASMLSFEKQRIANDINRVSDIMVQAKEEDETQTYVDANRVLHTLIHKESEADAALNSLKEHYQQKQPEYDYKAEEQRFLQLSDPKEIQSDAYAEWLRDNPYYNPYDAENYDADLSEDVHLIKRNFNKFLKSKRNGNFIGTDDYYQELTNIINVKLFGDYQIPQQNTGYSNQGYNQQEDDMVRHTIHIDPQYDQSLGSPIPEGQNRMHSQQYAEPDNYAPPQPTRQNYQQQQQQYQPQRQAPPRNVAPVSRAGYSAQYQSNNLPQLDATQRKLALSIPMYDTQSRPLSDSERLHVYAQGLAEMNRR
jgi:hypothetical protein